VYLALTIAPVAIATVTVCRGRDRQYPGDDD